MTTIKITEGVGYLSGDNVCFCIHPVPFEEWLKLAPRPEGQYPSEWFPAGFEDKRVRYRITIELEEATHDQPAHNTGIGTCLKAPRLDQIMEEIRKRLPGCLIKFAEKPQGIHCWVEAEQSWPQPWHGLGPNDTEAARRVLVQIMEAKP